MLTTNNSGDGLSNSQPTILEVARDYIKRGFAVVPIPRGRKSPLIKEWQKLRITEGEAANYFNGQPQNIGVLLGGPSKSLIDIDLDCAEAVALAPHFLPETPVTFGRKSKVRSHYLYYSAIKQAKYKAPDGKMICELRSDGGQTVFPCSVHPSGEAIEWASEGIPTSVTPEHIANAVGKLAACSLLAQEWPTGSRHDVALAVAGGLARAGWTRDEAIKFVVCAAEAGGDDEVEDREQAVSDTFEKIDTGNVKGWPSLAAIIGDKAVQRIREFLGITATTVEGSGEVPIIRANDRLPGEIADDALSALIEANDPPTLFVRAGKLTRVREDENGRPIIEMLSDAHLRERLGRVRFVNQSKKGSITIQTPMSVVQDLRARPSWPLPPLEAITESPTLRRNGSILSEPGYDPDTRLIYHPAKGFIMPSVPDSPSRADVEHALVTLIDVLGDFPFLDQASRANTLALILTPIIRPHIDLAPLALIDAPQAGTGKGLLTDVVSIIATGRPAAKGSAPREDDELEKRITALLSEGSTFVVFDDLAHTLRSSVLANALTASEWKGRILGRSEMIAVPQRATWVVTGNNIQLAGDIPRRCFHIRLDAKTSQPFRRDDFKHANLVGYVKENRGALLAALLILARSWHCAGCPPSAVKPLGSFEGFTRIIGGVLQHAGIPGFLDNADRLYEQADDESAEWEGFLRACIEVFGDAAVTSAAVALSLASDTSLQNSLPDLLANARASGKGDFTKLLGKALRMRADRQYGDDGLHVTRAGSDPRKKVAQWKFNKTKRKGDELHTRTNNN